MCDSIVATAAETGSGTTLFGKNSDRKQGECQPFVQYPGALHPRGARAKCTHLEIPQVAETYRVMGHSPWWIWGFEQGVNEHGVAIGNQTVFSREPVEAQPGLIGMDLVRLGLERGRGAREALEVIAALLETHGQGGPALAPGGAGYHNSFLIADPEQAWVMETSGRRWAARSVVLDGLSNHFTLGSNWDFGSRDLESFARSAGWWPGSGRLDLAAAYRNEHVPARISEGRLGRSRALLEAGRGQHDRRSFERLLRDHGDGGPAPPQGVTTDDEAYFTLCMHSEPVGTTTASLIAELPADRTAPWPAWVGFGTPCTGLFLPVYIEGAIPATLARGDGDECADSAWWSFERLRRAAARDFAKAAPVLRAGWVPFEEKLERERRAVETAARRAGAEGDRDRRAGLLSDFMQAAVEAALRRAAELTAHLAG